MLAQVHRYHGLVAGQQVLHAWKVCSEREQGWGPGDKCLWYASRPCKQLKAYVHGARLLHSARAAGPDQRTVTA